MISSVLFSLAVLSGASFATDEAANLGYIIGRAKACSVDRQIIRDFEDVADSQLLDMAVDEEDLNAARVAMGEGESAGRSAEVGDIPPQFSCDTIELNLY